VLRKSVLSRKTVFKISPSISFSLVFLEISGFRYCIVKRLTFVFCAVGVIRFCSLFLAVNVEMRLSACSRIWEVLRRLLLQLVCIWWDVVDAGASASVIVHPCLTTHQPFHFRFCSSPVHGLNYLARPGTARFSFKIPGPAKHIFLLKFTPVMAHFPAKIPGPARHIFLLKFQARQGTVSYKSSSPGTAHSAAKIPGPACFDDFTQTAFALPLFKLVNSAANVCPVEETDTIWKRLGGHSSQWQSVFGWTWLVEKFDLLHQFDWLGGRGRARVDWVDWVYTCLVQGPPPHARDCSAPSSIHTSMIRRIFMTPTRVWYAYDT